VYIFIGFIASTQRLKKHRHRCRNRACRSSDRRSESALEPEAVIVTARLKDRFESSRVSPLFELIARKRSLEFSDHEAAIRQCVLPTQRRHFGSTGG
jgi:hypothetical protein